MEEQKVRRTDLYSIPPHLIFIDNENVRVGYPEEKFQVLKENIRQNGVLEPVHVRKVDDKYALTHGFNRMRAVWELVEEGCEIISVKAITSKMTEEEELLQHITLNSGEPLTPYEISQIFIKLKNFGWKNKDIANKVGYTEQQVSSLIKFQSEAGMELKNEVKEGNISITNAVKLVRQTNSVTEQNSKIAEVRESNSGNRKIKAKDIFEESLSLRERLDKVFDLAEEQGVEDERIEFCRLLVKLASQSKNSAEKILSEILVNVV